MTANSWRKIKIRTPHSSAETVATMLTTLTGLGTEIDDSVGAGTAATVIGYLPEDFPQLAETLNAVADFLTDLNAAQPQLPRSEMLSESIPEEDWSRKWREGLKPFHLTDRFVIKPSWEEYPAAVDETIIEMDPGQAFGTGLHPSTRLVVELLEEQLATPPAPEAVLDLGTGTGILAICAALLGCGPVTAIDIDPAAVAAARANVAVNHLSAKITTAATPITELTGPFQLILANIIHNTLVELAPKLHELLAPGGLLLLAGILRGGQAENLKSKYADLGLRCLATREAGEWAALCLRKG